MRLFQTTAWSSVFICAPWSTPSSSPSEFLAAARTPLLDFRPVAFQKGIVRRHLVLAIKAQQRAGLPASTARLRSNSARGSPSRRSAPLQARCRDPRAPACRVRVAGRSAPSPARNATHGCRCPHSSRHLPTHRSGHRAKRETPCELARIEVLRKVRSRNQRGSVESSHVSCQSRVWEASRS